jgi:hypothetical protein
MWQISIETHGLARWNCMCCIDFQNDFPIGNLTDPNFFKEREAKLLHIIEQQLNPLSNIICKNCEFAIEVD